MVAALATSDKILYASAAFLGFNGVSKSITKKLLVFLHSYEEQTQLFAAINLLFEFGYLFSALLFQTLWAYTAATEYSNAFIYVLLAVTSTVFLSTLFLSSHRFESLNEAQSKVSF
jgi:hypothetical protein